MNQYIIVLPLLLTGLMLGGCKENKTPVDPEKMIYGFVKDEQGREYPNTKVNLFNEQTEYEVRTDKAGKFGFDVTELGDYKITILPPLSTSLLEDTIAIELLSENNVKVDFALQNHPVQALLVLDSVDIFGEIKNVAGMAPTDDSVKIYARNIFDPPLGKLTPIKSPTQTHLTLLDWNQAAGEVLVSCDGEKSDVEISLTGLIPNGTYTFWCDFLNKTKRAGESLSIGFDVSSIEALGSGTVNVVVADANGGIETTIIHPYCILTKDVALVLVVDYHINGNTYGNDHIPDEEDVNHMLCYFQ